MSQLGHQRTKSDVRLTSALPPDNRLRADIAARRLRAISCREQVQQCAVLINYLVGNGEYAWRNFKAQRVRGPQIDDQLKFGRWLHRQVGWLVAFEDTPSIDACLIVRFGKTATVADQTAG